MPADFRGRDVRELETSTSGYAIRIGHGVIRGLPRELPRILPARRYFLITDRSVHRRYGSRLLSRLRQAGLDVHALVVPAGEGTKTRESKAKLEDRMLARRAGRDSAILALGGGMVSDLAGFTAATFLRGIPYLSVPTTLLAMVDASIGGKTGVNHPRGKNLIGAFHPPRAVYADVDFLSGLPEREFRSGLAEVVKTAVIGDAALFRRLEESPESILGRRPSPLAELVAACVGVKAEIVAADERELNLRAVLNFGHTLGHALEHLSRHRLAHGEAVAIGMAMESRAAEAAGILKRGEAGRIIVLLERLGLPSRVPKGFPSSKVLAAARADKKSEGGELRYALPRRIGRMARRDGRYAMPLPDALVLEILSRR